MRRHRATILLLRKCGGDIRHRTEVWDRKTSPAGGEVQVLLAVLGADVAPGIEPVLDLLCYFRRCCGAGQQLLVACLEQRAVTRLPAVERIGEERRRAGGVGRNEVGNLLEPRI